MITLFRDSPMVNRFKRCSTIRTYRTNNRGSNQTRKDKHRPTKLPNLNTW